ncbi:MAG: ADP-ribosylglycohydrolase family protein [Bacteroidetes bacterium]|nr:ADP-ribosylglycohydrolase family protein [Bacteroidota bacterium]MDA1122266.1 ADP-ribosylglycohydrolase family protein [Bacteroidota bacterium]
MNSNGIKFALILLLIVAFSGCDKNQEQKNFLEVTKERSLSVSPLIKMSKDSLRNKILGVLVGSAIGDAMGAPTEMWTRDQIKLQYGYVDNLDNMIREPSPEGTWDYNLTAGGTTDDTRWKVLTGDFFIENSSSFFSKEGPDPSDFAEFIIDQYSEEVKGLKQIESFEPAPYEEQMRRIAWLQEWALVAKPFAANDLEGYNDAISKFYGGDMACAGMLYAPSIGILYPGAPDAAYNAAYSLAIFDIGYARDITALTSALVAAALPYDSTPEDILNVLKEIDPKGYFKSRLLGRSSYRIYSDALSIVDEARKTDDTGARLKMAYALLDAKNQDVPFHAGEIHLINLTAIIYSDFDFQKSLEFVINYGRDNDTVAAVTGAILGAYHGYDQLPKNLTQKVLKTNKEKLGIDLEKLADELVAKMISGSN